MKIGEMKYRHSYYSDTGWIYEVSEVIQPKNGGDLVWCPVVMEPFAKEEQAIDYIKQHSTNDENPFDAGLRSAFEECTRRGK